MLRGAKQRDRHRFTSQPSQPQQSLNAGNASADETTLKSATASTITIRGPGQATTQAQGRVASRPLASVSPVRTAQGDRPLLEAGEDRGREPAHHVQHDGLMAVNEAGGRRLHDVTFTGRSHHD